jgi:hypothetical protein
VREPTVAMLSLYLQAELSVHPEPTFNACGDFVAEAIAPDMVKAPKCCPLVKKRSDFEGPKEKTHGTPKVIFVETNVGVAPVERSV